MTPHKTITAHVFFSLASWSGARNTWLCGSKIPLAFASTITAVLFDVRVALRAARTYFFKY